MTGHLLWVAPETVHLATGGGGGIRHTHLLRRLVGEVPVRLVACGPEIDDEVAAGARDVVLVPPDAAAARHPAGHALRGLSGVSLPEVDAARGFRAAVPAAWVEGSGTTTVLCHLSTQPLAARAAGPVVAHLFHSTAAHLAREAAAAAGARRVRLRRYAQVARRRERAASAAAALTVVVSGSDAELVAGPGADVAVVGNGVDARSWALDDDDHGEDDGLPGRTVLLPGTLFFGPNVDGARFFVADVWPDVRRAVPDAELVIAGRSPVPEVRALGGQAGVTVRADVADMSEEHRRARVVVVPLRYGTGTRLKALEALAAGRSLVGTSVGLADLGIEDGVHARVADTAEGLARATIEALTADDAAPRERGRRLVHEQHGWDRRAEELLAALHHRDLLP